MDRDFRLQPHRKELLKRRRHREIAYQEKKDKKEKETVRTVRDQGSILRLLLRALDGVRDVAQLVMTYWPEVCSTQPFVKSMELLNLAEIGSCRELQTLTEQTHDHIVKKWMRHDHDLFYRNPEDRFHWTDAFCRLLARSPVICCWWNREYIFTTMGHVLMQWTRCFCVDTPCTEDCVDRCPGHLLCDCHHWLCECIDRDVCRRDIASRRPPWLWKTAEESKKATSILGFCEELLYALHNTNQYVVPQTLAFRFIGFCTTTWYPVLEMYYRDR